MAGGPGSTFAVKIRGVPWSSTETDVVNFFDNLELSESAVRFVYESNGRATGEGFVELKSAEVRHGQGNGAAKNLCPPASCLDVCARTLP